MCVGAVVHARVGTVVFGAADPKAGAVRSLLDPNALPLNHRFAVVEGVLAEECRDMLQQFFRSRRRSGERQFETGWGRIDCFSHRRHALCGAAALGGQRRYSIQLQATGCERSGTHSRAASGGSLGVRRSTPQNKHGEVREWLNRAVSKTAVPLRVPWVRIPPSPPNIADPPVEPAAGGILTGSDFRPNHCGEMREWLNRRDWKSREPVTPAPRVRIPLSPPAPLALSPAPRRPRAAGAESRRSRAWNG